MKQIRFDFNNLFSAAVGRRHGIEVKELRRIFPDILAAHEHLRSIITDRRNRINLGLEWANLPYQDKSLIRNIQRLGDQIAKNYENVLFLGIGGSYLGLKAAQEALCAPYYNDFSSQRRSRPKVYFEGNNLDPETIKTVLANLDAKKTFVVVISKSGETTETKAAFFSGYRLVKEEIRGALRAGGPGDH